MLSFRPSEPPGGARLLLRCRCRGWCPDWHRRPELDAPLLLLLLLLAVAVPVQSGASPLAAATASPRKPMTVATQF